MTRYVRTAYRLNVYKGDETLPALSNLGLTVTTPRRLHLLGISTLLES